MRAREGEDIPLAYLQNCHKYHEAWMDSVGGHQNITSRERGVCGGWRRKHKHKEDGENKAKTTRKTKPVNLSLHFFNVI